jgi:hypothetical protein
VNTLPWYSSRKNRISLDTVKSKGMGAAMEENVRKSAENRAKLKGGFSKRS